MPIALGESYALKWQAWAYYPDAIINLRLGGQLESFAFLAAVIVLVSSVTIVLAEKIDTKAKVTHKLKSKKQIHAKVHANLPYRKGKQK